VEKNEVTESDKGYSKVDSMLLSRAQGVFRSLPEAPSLNSPKAQLGKKLYFETALSANNEMSCNSCHLLDNFGVDNEPTSPGHEGKRGDRNSPSVYNASLHVAQFWDGRAADLVEQAKGPILNPIEMGIPDEATAELKIAKNSEYQALFAEAFPENPSISYQNIAEAIGAFEECLLTPSPFDEYLEGNVEALSEKQKEGLKTFIDAGCITCHMGSTLGGNMYQKFGLLNGPYWEYTSSVKQDRGRAEVTGNDAEEFMFKVPSLRNVEKTHPYFHDGSVKELDEAIRIMAKTQLNKDITEQEVESIVAFLQSLTGEIPANAVATNNEISKDEQV
jgi:cytochrome c peroxidase